MAWTRIAPDGVSERHFALTPYPRLSRIDGPRLDVRLYPWPSDIREVSLHHIWAPRGCRVIWHLRQGCWRPLADPVLEAQRRPVD